MSEVRFAVGDDDGDLRAGLYGWTWGGCGYIDLLWVRDDQRGSGLPLGVLVAGTAGRCRGGRRTSRRPGRNAEFGITAPS